MLDCGFTRRRRLPRRLFSLKGWGLALRRVSPGHKNSSLATASQTFTRDLSSMQRRHSQRDGAGACGSGGRPSAHSPGSQCPSVWSDRAVLPAFSCSHPLLCACRNTPPPRRRPHWLPPRRSRKPRSRRPPAPVPSLSQGPARCRSLRSRPHPASPGPRPPPMLHRQRPIARIALQACTRASSGAPRRSR